MEQTSTPPPPSSSSFSRSGEKRVWCQSILVALRAVASMESYSTLPYFRHIFATEMHNLEERRQADDDVNDVEGVLRLCFGINKNMVRVIADAAVATVALMAMEGVPTGGGGGTSMSLQQQQRGTGEGGGSSGHKANNTVTAGRALPSSRATTAGESHCCCCFCW
jgi:hypothetical protein